MAATSSLQSKGLGLVLVEFGYEYEGRDGVLVTIKPNERYILLAKTNNHWWQVQEDRSSKPFYIPAKYVKELPLELPSPLDFADPPSSEPVLPVMAPIPVAVPVPIPKPLEESRTKPSDDMTIRLTPDAVKRHHKNENRMSTFGVPLEFQDVAPRLPGAPAGPAEPGSTANSRTANSTDGKKQPHPSGYVEDVRDVGKPRVPSFSPADPLSVPRPHVQPIRVETPVIPPHSNLHNMSSSPAGRPDGHKSPIEPDEEELAEEEASVEENGEEERDSVKGEDSHHIYESIQDLNLDLEALVGGRASPAAQAEPATPEAAPAPPPTQNQSSPDPLSPIYANVPSLKKSAQPQSSSGSSLSSPPPTDHPPSTSDHSPSSSTSLGMISPNCPVSAQDRLQGHTEQDSRRQPGTNHMNDSRNPPPVPVRDLDRSKGKEGGQLTSTSPVISPASSQGSGGWEKVFDEVSGRPYYFNRSTRTTSWNLPEPCSPSPPPGSASHRKHEGGPPPLPEEDYPVGDHKDASFRTHPQQSLGLIPRAHLDLKDPQIPSVPQSLMGNGVCEDGASLQARKLRLSMGEDTCSHGHRRNFSDHTDMISRHASPDSPQLSNRCRLKRNLSNQSTGSSSQHGHLLEKAGILNKTKVAENGKKIRKNWSQSWTVLHGGILTFHKDPRPAGNASKASQIVPEYTVELRGASVSWACKDKSSKKNVLELKTRQGCEYLMQYDKESIIGDWLKVIQDTIGQLVPDGTHRPEQEHLSDSEDDASRIPSGADTEQTRVRSKLRRFLQRRPTLQSVKERGYIRDNVFGCHLDTLCHREHSTIPKFVEKCIRTVERRGLDVDGIYRVSGNLAVIQKLRHKADHEEHLDLEDGQWEEIHVITGALKLFLRELPEPLFPFSVFEKFIAAIQVPDYSLRVSYMKDLVQTLPLPNHNTMELLFRHLRKVIEHKDSNRMSVQSIAIVFGPTLLRPETESANMTIHMVFQSQIVELLLNEFQTVFSES
ncbi:rho GTPase-activating protein 27-like isoform X1 [Oreochromis aureus]|uniref:Rho GTPase activating protein 27, like n=1 Tax=Oreochromis aureus TaxID=47969 RepID=A0A668RVW5_OREAU|nr:rho GTPase-activating protein 27-like isoform X1 [Oreochromis aureus]XP_031594566.1 rho GTPase-activating protein 27-like isoform X1 [Oreochromis aureus]